MELRSTVFRGVTIFSVVLVLVAAYVAISLSPLVGFIGRSSPAFAAALSPPWFNFESSYISGDVLEFKLGMSRSELKQILVARYAKDAVFDGNCGTDAKYAMPEIHIDSAEGSVSLTKRDVLCVWNKSKRLHLIFFLRNDLVVRLRVIVTHNEL
jgi:hypothetical protein